MNNLELKNYALLSKAYNEMVNAVPNNCVTMEDRILKAELNGFYSEYLEPYWTQFDESDARLSTVMLSHLNDIQHDAENAAMRTRFVSWLLHRYPNTENVSILPNAEFAEFLNEYPHYK